MNLNEITSKNKNDNKDNDISDNEFKHQINLAINDSKKLGFLLSEEEQIKIAIQESLEEMKYNSRKFLKRKRNIIDDEEEEEEDEKSDFIKEKDIKKEYQKLIVKENNNESEEKIKIPISEKEKNKEMNEYKKEFLNLLKDSYNEESEEEENNDINYSLEDIARNENKEENNLIDDEAEEVDNDEDELDDNENEEEVDNENEEEDEDEDEDEEDEKEEKDEEEEEKDEEEEEKEDEEEKQLKYALKISKEEYIKKENLNSNQIIDLDESSNLDLSFKKEEFDENFGICPITQDYMKNPVLTPSGAYYEKSAILKWIKKHKTDPITRERLTKDMLQEDHEYKKKIKKYRKVFKK